MNNLTSEEIDCIYRCISIAMDWRGAVDDGIVEDRVGRDWLTYNIENALMAANKLAKNERDYPLWRDKDDSDKRG